MKLPLALFAFTFALALRAADLPPVFNATLTVGKEHRFVLLDASGKSSSFLSLGETFAGYKLKEYDAKSGELSLERDGKVTRVTLVADAATINAPVTTKATVTDANAVLTAMNFEQMMERTMAGVRKQQKQMIDRMMGQSVPPGAEREAALEMQKKVLDEMMSAIDFGEMKSEIAKVYSEIFTKEQLDGMTGFFNSPTGKAYAEKQPEIAEKMNAIMIPKMMAAMPKIQQMMKDFGAEQKARREAAKSGAPVPTSAAPKQ